ncbi:hypothetical protein EVAR_60534_1 [Eumeta japonica]|uniref:Uncharacterized protein n=1 Tax=Eumeta variegata TaxID=151549 RepID=A0A4C1YVT9_EUMVA|nr:hypothetical protein EVAR_60534_1 [Eumeta japonica]
MYRTRMQFSTTVILQRADYVTSAALTTVEPPTTDGIRSWVFHTLFAGAGRRTYVASCPGVFSSGIRPRRSSDNGPISGVQTLRFPETAGDQEELSVGTPTSSSTVTAASRSNGKVVDRRP